MNCPYCLVRVGTGEIHACNQRPSVVAFDENIKAARRERIATAALQGLLVASDSDGDGVPPRAAAVLAVEYAYALIAALDEKT